MNESLSADRVEGSVPAVSVASCIKLLPLIGRPVMVLDSMTCPSDDVSDSSTRALVLTVISFVIELKVRVKFSSIRSCKRRPIPVRFCGWNPAFHNLRPHSRPDVVPAPSRSRIC